MLTWLFRFADSSARCFSSSISYSRDLRSAIARSLFCPWLRCSEQKILMPAHGIYRLHPCKNGVPCLSASKHAFL